MEEMDCSSLFFGALIRTVIIVSDRWRWKQSTTTSTRFLLEYRVFSILSSRLDNTTAEDDLFLKAN